jgi:pilus assembly protein Flp/PilA
MTYFIKLAVRIQSILQDTAAQDLIEYAQMAGFVAVAAGALVPGIQDSISTIFSKVNSVIVSAGN